MPSVLPYVVAFSVGDISLYNDSLILGGRDMLIKLNQLPSSSRVTGAAPKERPPGVELGPCG